MPRRRCNISVEPRQKLRSTDQHETFSRRAMSIPPKPEDQPALPQQPEAPPIIVQGDAAVVQPIALSGNATVDTIIGQVIVQPPSLLTAQERRERQAMIGKVRRTWVEGFLRRSLVEMAWIELGLTERADLAQLPLNAQYQELHRPPRDLPADTPIIDSFDESGGSLLILGAPGAGKTMLLLGLCRDLLDRAAHDDAQPIPVVLNLSSWSVKDESLEHWLVKELNERYAVPRHIAQHWVNSNALLLLLDGLDEVAEQRRDGCAAAINVYREQHLVSLAICSRQTDYEALTTRLRIDSAVLVQPLSDQQVDTYMQAGGERLDGLRLSLTSEPELRALMHTPLMLSVASIAAKAMARPQPGKSWAESIWHAYIAVVLGRRKSFIALSRNALLSNLQQLARILIQQSQAIFFIERIQPQWLRSRALFGLAWAGSILSGLALLLIMMVLLSLLVGLLLAPWTILTMGPLTGSAAFSLVGLLGGMLSWLALVIAGVPGRTFLAEVEPFETASWSSRGLLVGGAVWAVSLGVFWYVNGSLSLTAAALTAIPAYVLAIGVGITGGTITATERPNEGIRRAVLVMGYIGLAAGLPLLFAGLSASLGVREGLIGGIVLGIMGIGVGLGVGAAKGGFSALKHMFIRLLLAWSGQFPLHLRPWLDAGVDRVLLYRVGGGYIFIHRLLMEHIAAMTDQDLEQLIATVDLSHKGQ